MSFRLASISLYFWFALDSIHKINKFEMIINIIDPFILKTPDNFFASFTIRSLSTLKSLEKDDINNILNWLFNNETTFWDSLNNNSTKCLSVLLKLNSIPP